MATEVMVKLEASDNSAFIAGGVSEGGCNIAKAVGIFGVVSSSGHWMITTDLGMDNISYSHCKLCIILTNPLSLSAMKNILKAGKIDVSVNKWHHLSLAIDVSPIYLFKL